MRENVTEVMFFLGAAVQKIYLLANAAESDSHR